MMVWLALMATLVLQTPAPVTNYEMTIARADNLSAKVTSWLTPAANVPCVTGPSETDTTPIQLGTASPIAFTAHFTPGDQPTLVCTYSAQLDPTLLTDGVSYVGELVAIDSTGARSTPITISINTFSKGSITPPPPPPPTVPAGPTNLQITAFDTTSQTLAWSDNATDETGYRVESCSALSNNTCSGTVTILATLPANAVTYNVTGLTPITTYFYQVKAFNAGGDSAPSNAISGTTATPPPPPPAVPPAPTNLQITAFDTVSQTLKWTDTSTVETGFRVESCSAASGTPLMCSGTITPLATVGANVTTFTVTGLTPSATYRYQVKAFNTSGDSLASNAVAGTTAAMPPPTDTTAPIVNITSVARSGKSSNYTVTASASDPGGSVNRVEFLLDNRLMGTLYVSPWSLSIRIDAAGSHVVTVRAYDAANNMGIASRTIVR